MKRVYRVIILALCLIMILSLCACGSKSAASSYSKEEPAYSTYNDSAVAAGNYGGFSAAETMYAAEEMYDTTGYSSENQSNSGGTDVPSENPEKIIYSSDATIETTEFDSTLEALKEMVEKYNGWIESSSLNGSNFSSIQQGKKTSRSAEYTIRVPGKSFNAIMGNLSSLGNIPSSHVYTSNVTSQYYDTQARLKTYQAQEERLIELLDMAKTVSDVIEVENELTDVRYRIESLQTSLNSWDRQVSYSTVYLKIKEVNEYTPEKNPGYGSRLLKSLENGFEDLGEFIIDLVGALPVLVIVAVLVVGVIHIIKRAIKGNTGRKMKREAKKAAAQITEKLGNTEK